MKLLVLAGTTEARGLIKALIASEHEVVASLAGATRHPLPLGCTTRIGGFGGFEAQKKFIKDNGFDAVVDGTHPFADRISARTAEVCATLHIPRLQLLRPGWTAEAGDRWTYIEREQDAAAKIPADAVVFLATGRQTILNFSNLSPRTVICRQIDPPGRISLFQMGNT